MPQMNNFLGNLYINFALIYERFYDLGSPDVLNESLPPACDSSQRIASGPAATTVHCSKNGLISINLCRTFQRISEVWDNVQT